MRAIALLICCVVALSGCYEELDWREWRAKDNSFVLLLPSKPKELSRELLIGEQPIQLHMISTYTDGLAFGVAYADVPLGVAPNLIRDARDALLKNIAGTTLSESTIESGNAKGIAFRASGLSNANPMLLAARVLRDDRRFYQVVFIGTHSRAVEVDVDFFLDSFKTTP